MHVPPVICYALDEESLYLFHRATKRPSDDKQKLYDELSRKLLKIEQPKEEAKRMLVEHEVNA